MNLKEYVVEIIKEVSNKDIKTEISDGDSLIESGVIDSLGMMELVSKIENRYNIQVDSNDLMPENFDSINAIVNYITKNT